MSFTEQRGLVSVTKKSVQESAKKDGDENTRVTTADGSKLPLLPSGPGGVHKSTFHGPWRTEEKRKRPQLASATSWRLITGVLDSGAFRRVFKLIALERLLKATANTPLVVEQTRA